VFLELQAGGQNKKGIHVYPNHPARCIPMQGIRSILHRSERANNLCEYICSRNNSALGKTSLH
ncbi:MAG TPA: hypothetical protein VJH37_04820, partial [Candidatus Nanoarchaeia archaeon]|nr:hypothetical protein [Candidatus Nanoarchaeia archaeon]